MTDQEFFEKYFSLISPIPSFIDKYLKLGMMKRLKNIGYFCGMDYASKDIYDFPHYVSRYDHSISVALITWKYTKDKKQTIAALFHDVSTPCFAHVIDYMNGDYLEQESTEKEAIAMLENNQELINLLKEDNIEVEDIINFKKYPIVDNNRPKLCADRLDGIFLTSLIWVKNTELNDIKMIIKDIDVFENEKGQPELGFKDETIAKIVYDISNIINEYCQSNSDNYMMNLLGDITKYAINKKVIAYEDLYTLTEKQLIKIFEDYSKKDNKFKGLFKEFKTKKLSDIPNIKYPTIKQRKINPLVKNKRLV